MSVKPIAIPERPRTRTYSPRPQPAEVRQHSGLIDGTGRAHAGGRQHFSIGDSFVGVGVSAPTKTPLFIANSTFRQTRPLPSTTADSPRRRPVPVSAVDTVRGKKHFDSPQRGSNPVEHRSESPMQTPTRVRRACISPAGNLNNSATPTRAESPSLGRRITGAPPVFVAPEFQKRPYSPQLRRVNRPSDSNDLISFDPAPRDNTPVRVGRRALAPTRSYDLITGQPLW